MAKFLPSTNEIMEFGKYAVGGIAEEMAGKWVKTNANISFINKYPIIVDGLAMLLGIYLSKMRGFKEIGTGFAITATANLMQEGFDLVTSMMNNPSQPEETK
jgi:hypothetical protein